MDTILAVGGPAPQIPPNWDFWLPAYMVLSFLLIVTLVRGRVTPWTGAVCLAAGTLWAWADNAMGVVPAGALAVLVAVLIGAVRRRIAAVGRQR
ncbi:MAG: hypothetical protein ACRDHU_00845 [Actinomycetota bacterium]